MNTRDETLFEDMGEEEAYTPSGYDGERAYQQEVAIPIWEDAAAYGGETYRLRIQRQNMDGTRSDLGHIAGDSSEAALINQWPEAGTYLIMPVDEHNRTLRDQPYRRTIATDHLLLKKKRAEMGHNGTSNAAAGIDPYVGLMTQQMELMQQRMERMEREYEAKQARMEHERTLERERIAEREKEIEQRALALTVEQNATSAELHQQILAAQQESYANNQQQLVTSMNATMMTMQQMNDARAESDSRQREREREQARQDEERKQREHERTIEREAMRLERERAQIETSQERERQMWREEAARRDEMRREDAKRREEFFADRLAVVNEQKNPLNAVQDLMKTFGYDVKDLLSLAQGAGQKSILETIAGTVADVVKTTVQNGGIPGVGGAQDDIDDDLVAVQVAPGQIEMVPRAALEQAAESQMDAQMIEQAQAMQAAAPQVQAQAQAPDGYIDGSSVFGKPGAGPILPPPQPVVIDTPVQEVVRPKVPLKVAKPARKAIRMLVGNLSGSAQDEWVGKIVRMVTETPETLEYLKVMTVRGALTEAGASSEMAELIITNLDAPEYAPFTEDIPRG